MKTRLTPSVLAAVTAALLTGTAAQAQVTGINTVTSSFATIQFDDTNSFKPSLLLFGTTNITPTVAPWSGPTWALASTTDFNTGDNARGDIMASVSLGNYVLSFANISLTQAALNTGFAQLLFTFSVEFQLDPTFGLLTQPTLFPNFVVNGTVQPGGVANVGGHINYSGVVTSGGPATVVETVNYIQNYSIPGPITGSIVAGLPVNGTTPTFIPNTTLTLDGVFAFTVDPASINVHSVPAPEPSSALLALLSLPLLLRRRKA